MFPAADYSPFTVGAGWRLQPPGCPPSSDGRLDLIMARGAFGSGEHETTASCLEILEQLDGIDGARVLDVGSGTGILAIAALRLGAASAVCLDVDPTAVASAAHNGALNGVADRQFHVVGGPDAIAGGGFDLVLANLYGDLLLRFGERIVASTRVGGRVLLSGIAWELDWDMRAHYSRTGCSVTVHRFLEAYSTVLLQRVR